MKQEEYEAKKQTLIADIERAFGGIKRDENVVEAINKIPNHVVREEERTEILEMGERWQKIPDQWLEQSQISLLIYASPFSFRYYLPAYLRWFLRFMDHEEDEFSVPAPVFRQVLVTLTAGEKDDYYHLQKYSLLNLEQSQAVARFLILQCERCVVLYEQDELKDPYSEPKFRGYRESLGYKNMYRLYQRPLVRHWGQFLESDSFTADFPYPDSSRRWKAQWKMPAKSKRQVYEVRKQALLAEIERAFGGVERGEGTTWHEANVIDDYGTPEEQAQARLLDTESQWQDVPDAWIGGGSQWTLTMMDAAGFHYYFPAYLSWCLRFPDCEDENFRSETFEGVDFILGIRPFESSGPALQEQFGLFTKEQKRAVAHFVQFRHEQWNYRFERTNFKLYRRRPRGGGDRWYKAAHAEIDEALTKYWGQFL